VSEKLEQVLDMLHKNNSVMRPKDGTSGEAYYKTAAVKRRIKRGKK